MARLVDAVRQFVDAHDLRGPGVVAVSGGADSVAMLRGLVEVGVSGLVVGHFNHRLRGEESDADEAFVRELAETLGLPCHVGSADVLAAGGNLEATARQLRYDWLTSLGRTWVATGHTADDQAETVLHRLIRGTGITGLRGIAQARPLDEFRRHAARPPASGRHPGRCRSSISRSWTSRSAPTRRTPTRRSPAPAFATSCYHC